jgi:tol-pal system protein YbgF
MRRIWLFGGVLLLAACKHNDGMPDGQMAEMNDTVNKLQVDQDKENHGFMNESMPGPQAPAAAKSATPPPQHTVQITDDVDDHQSDDPNDPSTRPAINVQGQGGGFVQPRSGSSTRSKNGRISPDSDNLQTNGPHSSALDPDAKKAYDDAIALVNQKQFDRALDALNGFLTKWPDHPYAENALYWKGECLFAKGEYLRASEQFEAVISKYGAGKKGADALLKLGMAQDKLGASDRAKEYWDRLRRDFPHSDAVKKIPKESH